MAVAMSNAWASSFTASSTKFISEASIAIMFVIRVAVPSVRHLYCSRRSSWRSLWSTGWIGSVLIRGPG